MTPLCKMIFILTALTFTVASPRKQMLTLQDYLAKADAGEQKWDKVEQQLKAQTTESRDDKSLREDHMKVPEELHGFSMVGSRLAEKQVRQ